jgi:hypothetical protein
MWERVTLLLFFFTTAFLVKSQDSLNTQYVVHHRHWVYHFSIVNVQNETDGKLYIDRVWKFFQAKPEFEEESAIILVRSHRLASMQDLLSEIPELAGNLNNWTAEEEDE